MMKNVDRLTVTDVSHILDISLSAVYAILHRGEMSYFRFGRSIRIRAQDLAEYMDRSHILFKE